MKEKSKIYKLIKKCLACWRVTGKYRFENRKKDFDSLCYILAGYKEYVWEDVFDRIKRFSPKEIDICIVSSGVYSPTLSKISKKNGWSYLSTKRNNISLIQNIVINNFKKAEWIFKIDEDIFVTKNFFDTLKRTYMYIEKNEKYNVGIVAPLIPLNSYGNTRLLELLNLENYYEKKFEKSKYGWHPNRQYYSNVNVAKFWWGEKNIIPSIDNLDDMFSSREFCFSICPVTYNIGAILFKRDFWIEFNKFRVGLGNGLGKDETLLCTMCINCSRPIFVAENTLVGHLSFTPQTEEIEKYYLNNKQHFSMINNE